MAKKKTKIKNYCKPKLSDTCLGARVNLVCTDYDGILPEGSEYDEDSCLSGQDIIEDIINILDDHTEQLDFTDFGCCLTYEASDPEVGVTLQDVMSTFEGHICDLLEKCGDVDDCGCQNSNNEPTQPCNTDCDNLQPSQNGLVFHTTGIGDVTLDSTYNNFTPITSYQLNYKTKVAGVFKITIDLDYTGNTLSSETFEVGVNIDGQQPASGAFNKDTVKVANNSKTLHFVVEVGKGVNLTPSFKKASTQSVVIEKAKVIIEKV